MLKKILSKKDCAECRFCCIFDQSASGWCSKDVNASENQFYGVTRAFHVAGRCIECGQCEMVCPSEVPIMLMNKKFIKDIDMCKRDEDGFIIIESDKEYCNNFGELLYYKDYKDYKN